MNKTFKQILIITGIIITICSCSSPKREYSSADSVEALMSTSDIAIEDLPLQTNEQNSDKVETIDRKIIKQGNIKFKTIDVNKTKLLILQTVKDLNGYISNDYVFGYSDRHEHRLTIRVPADKFDSLLEKISENVDKLDSKNIDVLDVTEEFIDVEVRIQTKKDLQNRYRELLKQATKLEDIINIEKEIGKLQTEIESVEGRMKYLKDRIEFSTLTVTYYQKTTTTFGFYTKFLEGIKSGWDIFLWFIIGLSHIWVFLFVAILAIYLISLRRKKKLNKT